MTLNNYIYNNKKKNYKLNYNTIIRIILYHSCTEIFCVFVLHFVDIALNTALSLRFSFHQLIIFIPTDYHKNMDYNKLNCLNASKITYCFIYFYKYTVSTNWYLTFYLRTLSFKIIHLIIISNIKYCL